MMTEAYRTAVDSSTLIASLGGAKGEDVLLFRKHLQAGDVALPPPVLVEALSNHRTRDQVIHILEEMPLLVLEENFWLRASELRANVLKHGHKARMADTLIAQCCIDHGVKLITRDADFKYFSKYGKLKLA